MERKTTIEEAKKVLGIDFLGPEELQRIRGSFKIKSQVRDRIPAIPFSSAVLKKLRGKYILILGVSSDSMGRPLTLNRLRQMFSIDPDVSEPCFYNQDWYLLHTFAKETTLQQRWYLIRKEVEQSSRGMEPNLLLRKLNHNEDFPSAILTALAFFAYWFHTGGKILWKHDFLWCKDHDDNGDRIYTGRYIDPAGKNKNGFNVHRYLSIRSCYGLAPERVGSR